MTDKVAAGVGITLLSMIIFWYGALLGEHLACADIQDALVLNGHGDIAVIVKTLMVCR